MAKSKVCSDGFHDLIPILSTRDSSLPDLYTVVRWCTVCGAVVVDSDCDGRTYAGKIRKMQTPDIAK